MITSSRRSFAPIVFADTSTLILGSMPGVPSLNAQQYYANPRNAFWTIMARLASVPLPQSYAERLAVLKTLRIGVWDVIEQCERPGSLDSAIERSSVVVNDIPSLLNDYPDIRLVAFNGRTAETLFKRHWAGQEHRSLKRCSMRTLPSSSPAHAALSLVEKFQQWQQTLSVD